MIDIGDGLYLWWELALTQNNGTSGYEAELGALIEMKISKNPNRIVSCGLNIVLRVFAEELTNGFMM